MMKYIKNTWQNKLVAIALIILGYLSIFIEDDATAFILLIIIAIPVFITKENCIAIIINQEDRDEET